MRLVLPALCVTVLSAAAPAAPVPAPAVALEAWRPVLAAAGLPADALGVDRSMMALYGSGPYARPLHEVLASDPLRVPALAQIHGAGFVADAGSIADVLARAGQAASIGVRRGVVDPIPPRLRRRLPAEQPFAAALAQLRAVSDTGVAPRYDDPPTADMPVELQRGLALLLAASADFLVWRERAFAEAPAAGLAAHLEDLRRFASVAEGEPAGGESLLHERRLDRLAAGLDIHALTAGAMDLALVLDDVRAELAGVDLGLVTSRRYATPLGDVVVGGPDADTHEGDAPLLIVDVGGDDIYTTGAGAADPRRPVAMVLDLGGNDRYEAAEGAVATWGAAVGGAAFLADAAGNDVYLGGDVTQGCGIAGVGVLWDGGGDDTYGGRLHAQGAAAFGLGVLADLSGDDAYTILQRGQGYGYTLGGGVLVDAAGADRYTAQDETVVYPSPQAREHNVSLAQGCGWGRRADFTTGRSLAGGIGWLADGGGGDSYTCGVYGQGVGHWYGVGMLSDLGGDDRYRGVWYTQGSGAAFGVGGLLDAEGDDEYTALGQATQGAGRDFGLGFLTDAEGDDSYTAAGIAMGAGDANGAGWLWDLAGNDRYSADGPVTLAAARLPGDPAELALSPRSITRTLGLFLDGGGNDRYSRAEAGDGRTWTVDPGPWATHAAGADR